MRGRDSPGLARTRALAKPALGWDASRGSAPRSSGRHQVLARDKGPAPLGSESRTASRAGRTLTPSLSLTSRHVYLFNELLTAIH